MKIRRSRGRRIAGWCCIALGKIGSFGLLWAFIVGAEPHPGRDAIDSDAMLGLAGIAPLFAMTLGAIAIGVWLLMRDDRT